MPVAIVGMHRSGTSMVTHVLHRAGLNLGDPGKLCPATPDNLDGHWEHTGFHSINEAILNELGGGWDAPPPLQKAYFDDARLATLRSLASQLISEFSATDPWGWKDPRTSLLIPFWKKLIPKLLIVVCVRNPLDVAASLHRRGLCSYAMGLKLWESYNSAILTASSPRTRVVTHYESHLEDPLAECKRLLRRLGCGLKSQAISKSGGTVKNTLQHNQFTTRQLVEFGVNGSILKLYQKLCAEADWKDPYPPPVESVASASAIHRNRTVDLAAVEVEVARQCLARAATSPRSTSDAAASTESLTLPAVLGEIADALQALTRQMANQAAASRAELALEIAQVKSEFTATLADVSENLDTVRDDVARNHAQTQDDMREMRLAADQPAPGEETIPKDAQHVAYRRMTSSLRDAVMMNTLRGSIVLVVSNGDIDLLKIPGRNAWHFPQNADGTFIGSHPGCSTAAIAHLEYQRSCKAGFFVLPETYSWWLQTYPDFRRHLENCYTIIFHKLGVGTIYSLVRAAAASTNPPPREAVASRAKSLADVLTDFRAIYGRNPNVLDWNTGICLEESLPGIAIFPATKCLVKQAMPKLPYLDRSIDIICTGAAGNDEHYEARRIAKAAVVTIDRTGSSQNPVDVKWLEASSKAETPSVSIIIPVYNNLAMTQTCLASLRETVPDNATVEIIVVDDASTDGTFHQLNRRIAEDTRIKLLRNDENRGFVETCNLGAAAATGEVLIFLNNDALPLAGWLEALLQTLRDFPDAGAVGGKMLFPDGRLQEAGGIIFRDASAAHFGRYEADCDQPLFSFVREVDYGSAALMATPKAVFDELGGFDLTFKPGYYEDTDYCFRLRASGRKVYFQPAAMAVHIEGATSGTDETVGMKRFQLINRNKFIARWSAVLRHHPLRPKQFAFAEWHHFAATGGGKEVKR